MLIQFFAELGGWNWILLGCVLLALEIVVPGVFLLWIGIAGLLTGALALQLTGVSWFGWQAQVVLFLVLSLLSAYGGSRIMKSREGDNDQPLLNQRADQLVGRTAILEEPIAQGFGRVRMDDTMWRVSGPDLPTGARVRVSGADGSTLRVEEA